MFDKTWVYKDERSNKWWRLVGLTDGRYIATWGRVGRASQGEAYYHELKAMEKIAEKEGKGYRLKNEAEKRAKRKKESVKSEPIENNLWDEFSKVD
jgi:predicted DNA-binding WGR domain protein